MHVSFKSKQAHCCGRWGRRSSLLVAKLQGHPVVDTVVPHVGLKNRAPLLQNNLVPAGVGLGRSQLLQSPQWFLGVALNPDLLPKTVIAHNLHRPAWSRKMPRPPWANPKAPTGAWTKRRMVGGPQGRNVGAGGDPRGGDAGLFLSPKEKRERRACCVSALGIQVIQCFRKCFLFLTSWNSYLWDCYVF